MFLSVQLPVTNDKLTGRQSNSLHIYKTRPKPCWPKYIEITIMMDSARETSDCRDLLYIRLKKM